jgi:hypothetical protein
MIESNYALFESECLLRPGTTRVLASTPLYGHCNLTAGPDPEVRPLFDLEGLKAWREARLQGYGELEAAVDKIGLLRSKPQHHQCGLSVSMILASCVPPLFLSRRGVE